MPKDRTRSYSLSHRFKASPYSRSPKRTKKCEPKSTFPSVGDEREWEEAKCPICMEHPHNAVLLLCSSHEKGCRPFMCDTSRRHSNCFDQFRKTSPPIQTTDIKEKFSQLGNFKKLERKLPCPLCRGQISGWIIVEPARTCMNLKKRSCSLESCDFFGTYSELRVHARHKHPSHRPTEADPTRQEEWTRLENETTYQDLLELEVREDIDLLDDYNSYFQGLDSDSEWEPMDMAMDLELPFTFNEMPVFHSDLYCPYLMGHWTWSPITEEFDHLEEIQTGNISDSSSRRSNSNRIIEEFDPLEIENDDNRGRRSSYRRRNSNRVTDEIENDNRGRGSSSRRSNSNRTAEEFDHLEIETDNRDRGSSSRRRNLNRIGEESDHLEIGTYNNNSGSSSRRSNSNQITEEIDHLEIENDNRDRERSYRRSNSNRGQRQPNRRL